MAVNKVIYGNSTIMDVTSVTVEPDALLSGYTAMDKSGQIINGTLEIATTADLATYFGYTAPSGS